VKREDVRNVSLLRDVIGVNLQYAQDAGKERWKMHARIAGCALIVISDVINACD
jgi:hypothetical protein